MRSVCSHALLKDVKRSLYSAREGEGGTISSQIKITLSFKSQGTEKFQETNSQNLRYETQVIADYEYVKTSKL